jgi:hypothetical protein
MANKLGWQQDRQENTRSEVLAECKEHDIKNAESVGIKLYDIFGTDQSGWVGT